jgi:hypothetical protein
MAIDFLLLVTGDHVESASGSGDILLASTEEGLDAAEDFSWMAVDIRSSTRRGGD